MFTHDGRFAVLAPWCKQFVPVEVAEEAQAFVAVLCFRLARLFGEYLASSAARDALEALGTIVIWLGRNLQCLEGGPAGKAGEALRVESL